MDSKGTQDTVYRRGHKEGSVKYRDASHLPPKIGYIIELKDFLLPFTDLVREWEVKSTRFPSAAQLQYQAALTPSSLSVCILRVTYYRGQNSTEHWDNLSFYISIVQNRILRQSILFLQFRAAQIRMLRQSFYLYSSEEQRDRAFPAKANLIKTFP